MQRRPIAEHDSADLRRTQVVAHLDEPLESGQNGLYCASLLGAWQALWREVVTEPPRMRAGGLSMAMNRAVDVRSFVGPDHLYSAAGWKHHGIAERIVRELAERFPTERSRTSTGICSPMPTSRRA